ncbi:MAG: hypothetical protein ACOVLE_00800, partial [Pirellula staleyi]
MGSFQKVDRSDLDDFRKQLKKCETIASDRMSSGWLAKMDSILTAQAMPRATMAGEVFVRRAMSHRTAARRPTVRLSTQAQRAIPAPTTASAASDPCPNDLVSLDSK